MIRCALIALALVLAVPGAASRAEPTMPVVIEMFTSQGCNSCPPADLLLQDWAKERSVIVLSLHVDYWDYLGWRDTFGKRGHTDRQQAYARSTGSRQVYTPQAVVDGQYPVVGSNRAAVEAAIHNAKRDMHLALNAERDAAGRPKRLNIPGFRPWTGEATIWLCLYDKQHDVAVQLGENSGKTLTYVNVARAWQDMGRWTGDPLSVDLATRLDGFDWEAKGAVILVQSSRGPIIGAIDLGRR